MDAETLISMQGQEIALLKGAIAAQDERERKAGERCAVPYEQHGCDWPDWMAEKLLSQAARIAQLEALKQPIQTAIAAAISLGVSRGGSLVEKAWRETLQKAEDEIDAILKGGA
jgi:hypothetical protein